MLYILVKVDMGDTMDKQIVLSLKEVLDKRNMTRYELAKRTGTQFPVIDRYYKNKISRYDKDLILRICLALDCEVSDIIKIV